MEGNALAVFPDSRGLDGATMQKIAQELNLSETVFIEEATLPGCAKSLRIFTPAKEMLFAGHPTIGASYVLLEEGLIPKGTVSFAVQEKIGPVAIHVELTDPDPPLLWLETPPITFEVPVAADKCADLLGLPPASLLPVEPWIVNAGNPTLLIPLKDVAAVDAASLDTDLFSKLEVGRPRPFCVFVFTPTGYGAYSRMFAPGYGIPEDPATGSSTGPLAAFMKRHHLLENSGRGRFVSEQGTRMGRRSLLHFEISETPEGDRILVGGHVTPIIEAFLSL